MTFAQRRNRLTTYFSEHIPVVKRRLSVLNWKQGCPLLCSYGLEHLDLKLPGGLAQGRTLCVQNCTLRISTCHWQPEVVGIRTASLCVHFLNLFCLDIPLYPNNVSHITFSYFNYGLKHMYRISDFILSLVVNEEEQTEVSRWPYNFYQVRMHCASSLASRQMGLYGIYNEQIVAIQIVNKRPVIKSEFLLRAVTNLVQ
jgi:hypothetical protein